MRVLVVEDDTRMAEFVATGLRQAGFTVSCAADGEQGVATAMHNEFDVLVVDVMLPKLNGLEMIEQLRAADVDTPALVLSALSSVDDRIAGLKSGGDDYLVKPFSFAELVARLETIARRARRSESSPQTIVGEISIDRERHLATVNGHEMDLQRREFMLLAYLVKNQGRVVSKTMILDQVWGYDFDPRTNVVEAKISKLRSKIAEFSDRDWIHTVRGLGYKFEERG